MYRDFPQTSWVLKTLRTESPEVRLAYCYKASEDVKTSEKVKFLEIQGSLPGDFPSWQGAL